MERLDFNEQIRSNKIKSFFLIVSILFVFTLFGYLISLVVDPSLFFIIMIFASLIGVVYVLMGYYNSDKIALNSVRAKKASKAEYGAVYDLVENMSIASGLPMPRVYIMDSGQINAFASGRDPSRAVICLTTGAIHKLDKGELEGVIAHEMGHIANYDIRFMTLVAILVGMISIAAQMYLRSLWFGSFGNDNRDGRTKIILFVISILAAILAPILVKLVSLSISRKREFSADATAVKLTRYSPGLKRALQKIKRDHLSESEKRKFPEAVAPLFISDPFKKKISGLFSTHPDIDERIKKLERM